MSPENPLPAENNGNGNWHVGFQLDGQWYIDPTPMGQETASRWISYMQEQEPTKKWAILKEGLEIEDTSTKQDFGLTWD